MTKLQAKETEGLSEPGLVIRPACPEAAQAVPLPCRTLRSTRRPGPAHLRLHAAFARAYPRPTFPNLSYPSPLPPIT